MMEQDPPRNPCDRTPSELLHYVGLLSYLNH